MTNFPLKMHIHPTIEYTMINNTKILKICANNYIKQTERQLVLPALGRSGREELLVMLMLSQSEYSLKD